MRRSSPWTWWDWSGHTRGLSTCIHIEVMNCTRWWSFKSKDHTRCLALTLLTGPAGHLQSHRDWSLSGEARTENHSSGQLAHYTHWSWGTQQGNVMQIVRPMTWNLIYHISYIITKQCAIHTCKRLCMEGCKRLVALYLEGDWNTEPQSGV